MINEVLINDIEAFLNTKFKSKPKRLKHIYNVKKVAITLGKTYNSDIPSVIVASYLHDATKIDTLEENITFAGNLIDEGVPKACIHAYAACKLAIQTFHIEDQDILNAIKYHCSGRKAMSLLEKIIYVSDFIEEGRDFVHQELRQLAFQDLDKTVYKIMLQTKDYIVKHNQEFSSLTEEAITYYKLKLEELND